MMTRKRLWNWLVAMTALGRKLNPRGERLYLAMLRRNARYGSPS